MGSSTGCTQWSVEPIWIKDTLGSAICPWLERLSFLKNANRKGVHKSVLCWKIFPFLEGPLSKIPLIIILFGCQINFPKFGYSCYCNDHDISKKGSTVEPLIKGPQRKKQPPNRDILLATFSCSSSSSSFLTSEKRTTFSIKNKMAGPKVSFIRRFHCSSFLSTEKRTTSQQRTKMACPKVSFIRRFHCISLW